MVSSKVKQDNAEINFVSTGLNLMKKNVPLGAFWHRLGQVNFFGSSKTSAWFESLDSKVKDSLSIALVEDMKNMANEPLLKTNESLSDREKAIKISQRFKDQNPNFHPSGLHLLPFPLSLMNKKQKLKYLANSISEEANKNNHGRLSFAEEESKPSWWLEEMWGWINVNKSLHSIKETMYTGEGTFDEFITKSMINLLHLAGMDPERDILSMEGKSNILAKKRKQRGILEPSKALEYAEIGKVQPQHNKFVGFTTPRLSSNPIRSTLSSQPVTYCTPTSTPPPGQEQAQYGLSHEGSSGSSNFESPKQSNEKLEGNDDLNENEVLLTEVFESVNTASEISSEVLKEVPLIGSLSSFDLLNSGKDGGQFTYQPRRAIGDSPFKCATNSAKIKKRKIQFQGFDRSKKSKVDSTAFVKVPGALESQLGDCMIQRNSGGCSSSLYKAAMQHVNVGNFVASEEGFEQLQSFAHAKLVEWWPSFGHLFSFPTEVKVESENNARIVKIPDGEAFKKFLKSDESLYASLSKEVEIWILSYVLNTYIFLLTCDVHDQAVPGSALVGVPQWKTYAGTNVVSGLISPYTSNTNNLWLLIKDSDAEIQRIVINAEVESFERNLNVVVELVDGNDNLIMRKQKEKKSKKEPRTHIMTKERKEKLLRKTKGSKKKASTILRINSTKSKQVSETIKNIEDKNVATKSEIYYIFEIKQNKISIDDMPKIPTNSVQEKELELDKLDLSIATSRAEFEKEMARVDRSIARERKRQSEFKERLVENSVRRDRLEKELSAPVLRGMFRKNKDYFMKIKCGEVKSLRHNEYFESGIKRDKLNFQKIVDPFNDEHLKVLWEELSLIWMKTKKDISDNAEYMEKVMVSECFLKFYMDFFDIDDTKEAEQRILETPVDGDSDGELYL